MHESTNLTGAFERATKEAKRKLDFSQGREVGSVSKKRSQYLLDKKTGIPESRGGRKMGKGRVTEGHRLRWAAMKEREKRISRV